MPQSLGHFRHKLNSNYFQAENSVLENHPTSPRQKILYWLARSIKEQDGVLRGNEGYIISRRREHFKNLLNPVTLNRLDT